MMYFSPLPAGFIREAHLRAATKQAGFKYTYGRKWRCILIKETHLSEVKAVDYELLFGRLGLTVEEFKEFVIGQAERFKTVLVILCDDALFIHPDSFELIMVKLVRKCRK